MPRKKRETQENTLPIAKDVKYNKANTTTYKLKLRREMLPFLTDRQFNTISKSNEDALKWVASHRLSAYKKDCIYSELLKANYPIVINCAQQLYSKYSFIISLDDLMNACNLGLAKAFKAYNPDKNTKFSSFAMSCVMNEGRYAQRTANRYYEREQSIEAPLGQDKDGKEKKVEDKLYYETEAIKGEYNPSYFNKFINKNLSFLEKYTLYNYHELRENTYLSQKQMALLLEYPRNHITSKHQQAKIKIKNDYAGPISWEECEDNKEV